MVSLGLGIAVAGDLVSTFVQDRNNPTVWNNMIGILFILWMNPISKEAAFIIRNPGTAITLFSPLIIYIVLGVITMIIVVSLVYRRYGRELFNRT
jgi:hypothetical protein